jgi:hypothetical protein
LLSRISPSFDRVRGTSRNDSHYRNHLSDLGIILTVHGGPEKASGLLTGVIDGQTLFDRVQSQLQRQYPTVTYTRLKCVNDDPDFLSIAAGWANPQIEAMLSGSKIATRK